MRLFAGKWLLLVSCWLLVGILDAQTERILNYEVMLEVNKDRSLSIKEEIKVVAAGQKIRRGIYRALPRSRTFENGRTVPVRYHITKILRDGQPEPYHTRKEGSMEVLYLGRREYFLPPGEYNYTIEYEVPNQVEALEEIDEIYWNVIGQYWDFPIEQATCLVKLPATTASLQNACYTGSYGATEKNCTIESHNQGNEILFQTTQPLQAKEGMTIGVGFEKGAVEAPSFLERFGSALLLGFTSLGLLFYFVTTWNKYGIDPPKPTPYPQFAAPQGKSPASIGYIAKEYYQKNKITASIINLAVNGYLKIEEEEKTGFLSRGKNYTLIQLKEPDDSLFKEDRALMNTLFANDNQVVIDGTYDSNVKHAFEDHKGSIYAQYHDFVTEGNNRHFLALPIIVSFLAIAAAVYMMNRTGTSMDGLGMILFSAVFIGLPLFILVGAIMSAKKTGWAKLIFIIPFLLVFMAVGGAPLLLGVTGIKGMIFSSGANPNLVALALFIPLALIALFVYGYLIKRPTSEKLKLQSEIEGFKMYLEMAEKDRINLLNPPDRTPEHFEAMLPFAFALGVEHKWSSIFKDILEKAAYQPEWSNNRHFHHQPHLFASGFNQTMNSSATPPQSSGGGFGGGSGGGGFSGGGGGGGGGGGW